ncbi:hypothetical protein [Streptomyces sp. N2A]|nr:hypothetical protein [Streptomyces sp. N2A]
MCISRRFSSYIGVVLTSGWRARSSASRARCSCSAARSSLSTVAW